MLLANNLVLNLPQSVKVAPLSFKLLEGHLLWVRGENGAGKSTLLKTLLGLKPLQSGQIDWTTGRPSVFYLAHDLALQPQLTVLEYCRWHPALSQVPSPQALKAALTQVNLLPQAQHLCGQLSRGQQQRLLLACAQLSQSKLWLLDEPLTALDTPSRAIVLDCLQAHKKNAGAAIVVSHYPIPEVSDEVLDVA